MNTEIAIQVQDLIATPVGDQKIICGNSEYTVALYLDSMWDPFFMKTVRFEWLDTLSGQKRHIDATYTSNPIPIPTAATQDVYELKIGVYAGNLMSSTPARVPCERCVTDGATYHGDTESPDVYADLLEALENLTGGGAPPKIMRPKVHGGVAGHFETLEVPAALRMMAMLAMANPQSGEENEEETEDEVNGDNTGGD